MPHHPPEISMAKQGFELRVEDDVMVLANLKFPSLQASTCTSTVWELLECYGFLGLWDIGEGLGKFSEEGSGPPL